MTCFVIECRIKDNVKNSGGARLNSNFELFSVGFSSENGRRSMDHFNFGPRNRSNVVSAPAVTNKLKHTGDGRTVNIYQKPRHLLDWMVGHFSFPGDWVLDLCSGSGTGLAAALAHGRHCISVEIDVRQFSVLKGRVLSLVAHLDGDEKESLAEGVDVGTLPGDLQPELPVLEGGQTTLGATTENVVGSSDVEGEGAGKTVVGDVGVASTSSSALLAGGSAVVDGSTGVGADVDASAS